MAEFTEAQLQYEKLRQDAIAAFPPDVLARMAAFDSQLFFALTMPETFYRPFSEFHLSLLSLVQNNQRTGRREGRIGPRGWGKSTTITEGGSLLITCRNSYIPPEQRYKFILILSETSSQAEARLETIKANLETNPNIAKYYPEAFGKGKVWRTDRILTANGICIATGGMNCSLRGIKFENRRPDVILLDDVDSLDTATSPTESAKLEERFTRDVLKCGYDETDVFVVGTILSKKCLCYKLMHGDDFATWNVEKYKALKSFPRNMDYWDKFGSILNDRRKPLEQRKVECMQFYLQNKEAMDEGGESAWPDVMPVYKLMCEYYMEGRRSFLTEKQNDVIETDISYFTPEKYKYISAAESQELLRTNPIIYMYIDPTGGEASSRSQYAQRGPDKFAAALLAKVTDDLFMLVDFVAAACRQSLQFEHITRMLEKWRVTRMTVEGNAGQTHYINALKTYLTAQYADTDWRQRAKTQHLLYPRTVMSSVAKEARIAALEPHLANHTILLPEEMMESRSHYRELADELSDWPNCDFDDGLDAFSGAFFSGFRNFRFAALYNGN